MRQFRISFYLISNLLLATISLTTCDDENITDIIQPEIELIYPQSCDTLFIGESFIIKSLLSDNQGLSSFNIEIHNNFDAHSHSSETIVCHLDEKKVPVNPFKYNKSQPIPEKLIQYTTNVEITVPAGLDTGDYHINISVIDKTGWQTYKVSSIKLLRK